MPLLYGRHRQRTLSLPRQETNRRRALDDEYLRHWIGSSTSETSVPPSVLPPGLFGRSSRPRARECRPCAAHRRLAMRVGSIPPHHALPTCSGHPDPRPKNGVSRRFCYHKWRVDGELGGGSVGPVLW